MGRDVFVMPGGQPRGDGGRQRATESGAQGETADTVGVPRKHVVLYASGMQIIGEHVQEGKKRGPSMRDSRREGGLGTGAREVSQGCRRNTGSVCPGSRGQVQEGVRTQARLLRVPMAPNRT